MSFVVFPLTKLTDMESSLLNCTKLTAMESSLLNRLKSVTIRSYRFGIFSHINCYLKIISPVPVPELRQWVNRSMFENRHHSQALYLWRRSMSTRPFPMLMLPEENSHNTNSKARDFFDICNNNIYRFYLPELDQSWCCCGSSEGWLIYMNMESFRIRLLDPMSKAEKHLPPIDELEDKELSRSSSDPIRSFNFKEKLKVVLSSDPNSTNGYVAMAIVFRKLFFFRHDDDKWTPITTPRYAYQDVIYYKGMFYAVSHMGHVMTFDVMANPCKVTDTLQGWSDYEIDIDNMDSKDIELVRLKYLVESLGELLYVERLIKRVRNSDHFYITVGFEVCKVDQDSGLFVSLRSLSDQMLFLGHNTSLSLSFRDYRVYRDIGLRRNCIYFTDDFAEAYHKSSHGYYDMGFFLIEEEYIKRVKLCAPFWPRQIIWVVMNMPPPTKDVSQMNVEGGSNPSKIAWSNKFEVPFVLF